MSIAKYRIIDNLMLILRKLTRMEQSFVLALSTEWDSGWEALTEEGVTVAFDGDGGGGAVAGVNLE